MPLPKFDCTQPREGESIAEYNDRPLFPKPSITKVLSRHAGSVLGNPDPIVDLNVKIMADELHDFNEAFNNISDNDNHLKVSKFGDLLKKLDINLSKDSYIKFVDDAIDNKNHHKHQHHHVHVDDEKKLNSKNALLLYERVFAPAHYYGTHLRMAAGRNDVDLMEELIARGCNINTADGNNHTPLHHATTHGCKEAIKCLYSHSGKGGKGGVKLVVDPKDHRGWTPLHIAASSGLVDVFRQLIDMHADVKVCNVEGRNSLHIACSKGMDKIVKIILASSSGGGLVNSVSEKGWTPLFDAAFHAHDHIILMLQKGKAKKDVGDLLGFTADHYYSGRKGDVIFADWN